MSSIADRLRGIVRPGESRELGTSKESGGSNRLRAERAAASLAEARENISRAQAEEQDPSYGVDAAEILDGEWIKSGRHRFLVVERTYAPGHRHGSSSVADGLPPDEGWSRLGLLAGVPCGSNLLFIDLETTGLAGGAGSYAFIVGCGWFERGRFHVRQFL